MLGRVEVMSYEASLDCIRQPGQDDNRQESDYYWFYDAAADVGGDQGIGQKFEIGAGQVTMFARPPGDGRFALDDGIANDGPMVADSNWGGGLLRFRPLLNPARSPRMPAEDDTLYMAVDRSASILVDYNLRNSIIEL